MSKLTGEWLAALVTSDTGTGDGSSVTFAVTGKFSSAGAIWVYVDGLKRTDYTVNLSLNQITFSTAPALAQNIEIKYIKKSL